MRASRRTADAGSSGRSGWAPAVQWALVVALLVCLGTAVSYAYWTDQVDVPGTALTAGRLDLTVNNDADDAVTITGLTLTGMAPGNSVATVLTVRNVGTVPLRYLATTVASDDGKHLAAAVTVRVTSASAVTGSAPSASCSGSVVAGTATNLTQSLVSTGRTLAPSASETLCVQATLPANAPGTLQTASTTVTFTFTASSELT
jgi:predicted ribosomally synthesized peptide with SipW-like signal peptide